jgi:hypothetical protein
VGCSRLLLRSQCASVTGANPQRNARRARAPGPGAHSDGRTRNTLNPGCMSVADHCRRRHRCTRIPGNREVRHNLPVWHLPTPQTGATIACGILIAQGAARAILRLWHLLHFRTCLRPRLRWSDASPSTRRGTDASTGHLNTCNSIASDAGLNTVYRPITWEPARVSRGHASQ